MLPFDNHNERKVRDMASHGIKAVVLDNNDEGRPQMQMGLVLVPTKLVVSGLRTVWRLVMLLGNIVVLIFFLERLMLRLPRFHVRL